MATVAKLTDVGDLQIAGNIDTRLPLVTEGLVAHYPFDGVTGGIANNNLIDYSTWVIGSSGAQPGFGRNGSLAENIITEDIGPFGEPQAVWEVPLSDIASDADGGWNTSQFSIDPTVPYRFSVWTRVINPSTDASSNMHFGLRAYGTNNGVYDHSAGAATALNNNFYFQAPHASTFFNEAGDKWILRVAHVFPHDNTVYVDNPESGHYYANNTTKIATLGGMNDARWDPTSATSFHRAYVYYSEGVDLNVQWCYPRADKLDGTEPSIEDLVRGEGNIANGSPSASTGTTTDGVYLGSGTTNLYTDGDFRAKELHPVRSGAWSFPDTAFSPDGHPVIQVTSGGYHGKDIPVTTGTSYTTSCYMYVSTDFNGTYARLAGEQAFAPDVFYDLTKKGTWQKLTISGVTSGTSARILLYTANVTTGVMYATDIQFEAKNHVTAFTPDTRVGNSTLEIPFDLKPPYSIHFKHKSSWPIADQVDQPSYPYILQMGHYHSNASISFWNYGRALKTYVKGDFSSGWTFTGGNHYTYNAGNWENVWHDYTLVALSDTVFEVYIDGNKSSFNIVSTEAVTNINVLKLGYTGDNEEATFRDFSIYDRALTGADITKNVKGVHSVSAGGLLATSISTVDSSIPALSPTKMKATEYGLLIQGEITTNFSL